MLKFSNFIFFKEFFLEKNYFEIFGNNVIFKLKYS
jgi:hypothetical protein